MIDERRHRFSSCIWAFEHDGHDCSNELVDDETLKHYENNG